jgi:plastocyanin
MPLIMSLLLLALPFAAFGSPEPVTVTLQKADGSPLENAVVFVDAGELPPVPAPVGKKNKAPPAPPAIPEVVVMQKDQEFSPFVSVVPKGATVKFQNHDKVQHNVYSFSSGEKLNFPLHGAGVELSTKSLEKTGEVELGCNIHDWMSAYLFVVNSPVYAVTGKDGKATLALSPEKAARIQVWHPYLKDKKILPFLEYQPGRALAPLKLQVKSVFKPPREIY